MFPQTEHFQTGLKSATLVGRQNTKINCTPESTGKYAFKNEGGLRKGFNLNIADGTTDPGTECFYSINNATLKNDTVLKS